MALWKTQTDEDIEVEKADADGQCSSPLEICLASSFSDSETDGEVSDSCDSASTDREQANKKMKKNQFIFEDEKRHATRLLIDRNDQNEFEFINMDELDEPIVDLERWVVVCEDEEDHSP